MFFEKAILKMYFLREQFFEKVFENVFFEGAVLKMYFLREKF